MIIKIKEFTFMKLTIDIVKKKTFIIIIILIFMMMMKMINHMKDGYVLKEFKARIN